METKEGELVLDLVDSYTGVVENAKEFHNNIDEDLIRKLSLFRHWYYIEEIDAFAPSKFIGYKDVTVVDYKIGTKLGQGYMDGRDTVKQLKQWFKLVNDEEFDFYCEKLEDFLFQYDKKPNKKLQLYYKK